MGAIVPPSALLRAVVVAVTVGDADVDGADELVGDADNVGTLLTLGTLLGDLEADGLGVMVGILLTLG